MARGWRDCGARRAAKLSMAPDTEHRVRIPSTQPTGTRTRRNHSVGHFSGHCCVRPRRPIRSTESTQILVLKCSVDTCNTGFRHPSRALPEAGSASIALNATVPIRILQRYIAREVYRYLPRGWLPGPWVWLTP
jgi:hypothetical protein